MPTSLPALTSRPRDAALDLLKWLALLSMLIDHLRHVWPPLYALYIPGRLAFPLFCLAIAANLVRPSPHARTPLPLRYLGLLLLFALLSEWPYRLLVQAPQSLNVLPTLVLGLLIASGVQQPHGQARWLALGALLLAVAAHSWLMFGLAGALLPAAFVHALNRPSPAWIWPLLLCLIANYWPPFYIDAARGEPFAWTVILSCALAPLFGLWLLRQPLQIGVPPVRRWAYLFYPGHFLVLAALREYWLR
ncbi:TraX family protein [Pseudomonas sp. SA3-5]|uniref:TraX family protein n=1 Tax=Pseudomonas aestuarii TaxID=3018340 RepID=A0ABT4XMF2_9PSED|nr:TraX family protein [Pseudomonas aestuarii]MDA7089308.1 TraX family protein [Pseudomonas aestuarii]